MARTPAKELLRLRGPALAGLVALLALGAPAGSGAKGNSFTNSRSGSGWVTVAATRASEGCSRTTSSSLTSISQSTVC